MSKPLSAEVEHLKWGSHCGTLLGVCKAELLAGQHIRSHLHGESRRTRDHGNPSGTVISAAGQAGLLTTGSQASSLAAGARAGRFWPDLAGDLAPLRQGPTRLPARQHSAFSPALTAAGSQVMKSVICFLIGGRRVHGVDRVAQCWGVLTSTCLIYRSRVEWSRECMSRWPAILEQVKG